MSTALKVTLIQTHLHREDKVANLQMLRQKVMSIEGSTHLVVLPEMFSTGFSMNHQHIAEVMDGSSMQWMRQLSADRRAILAGSLAIRDTDPNGHEAYYNRLVWMQPNAQYGYYDKRHLFALGGENEQYAPGRKRLITSVNEWKINLQICYDLRFPVWARQTPQNDKNNLYDVLLYVANWPQSRSLAWKTLLQARAIENQCYVIGVNRLGTDGNGISYCGDSMVAGPMGEVLFHKKDEECTHTISLDKNRLNQVREKFPFWKDADAFLIQ